MNNMKNRSHVKETKASALIRRSLMGAAAVLGILCFTVGLAACDESANGSDFFESIFGHTHHYTSQVIQPDCTNGGYTLHTCSCGESYEDSYTQPTGHKKSGVGVHQEMTCTQDGGTKYVCGVCGTQFIDPETYVASPGHQLKTTPGIPATCTGEGLSDKVQCLVCGLVLQEQVVLGKLDHTDQNGDDYCDRCKKLLASDYKSISSADELMGIASNLRGKYILTKDISLSGVNWKALGTETEPFSGTLNGNGFSIRDFSRPEGSALFKYNTGKIVNVKLDGVSLDLINYSYEAAGFAVYNRGTISGCSISGLRANYTVDQSKETSYPNYDGGSVGGAACFGGFAAYNEGTIENCVIENGYSVVCTVSSYYKLNPAFFFLDADYKFTVNIGFTFGGFAGKNRGRIIGCTASQVSAISLNVCAASANSHGTAYSNLTCHVGAVAGENSLTVQSCVVQSPVISKNCGEKCTLNVYECNA